MRSAALVSRVGSIDWLCFPRFDSPAVFLKILDGQKGGSCELQLDGLQQKSRRYLSGTNILETTLRCVDGTLIVTDFLCVRQRNSEDYQADSDTDRVLLRLLQCSEGTIELRVVVRPTFDYARSRHTVETPDRFCVFRSEQGDALAVQCSADADISQPDCPRWHLGAGASGWLAIGYLFTDEQPLSLSDEAVLRKYEETLTYWQAWSSRCTYQGRWREPVLRSVLCLKLLTYAPTGAIVAAPTCGLPEAKGGERNWDYRYTWLRDASFTVSAFLNCGYEREAGAFLQFLERADSSCGSALQVLYGIEYNLIKEERLDHLDGYYGSRPITIGNSASQQLQTDIYGEFLASLDQFLKIAGDADRFEPLYGYARLIENIVECVLTRWQEPDNGLWEVRAGQQNFLHSKGMCWVALDRAIQIVQRLKLPLDTYSWERTRDQIRSEYMEKAWNPTRQALMQAFGSEALDASAMRLVLFGALDAREPKMAATITTIERELKSGDFVYRYRTEDGLQGKEGAFTVCSFWLASNLALAGRIEEAQELLERMINYGNDLGLFAEEINPDTGEQLGNFPQAFTHMALINNVIRIESLLETKVCQF